MFIYLLKIEGVTPLEPFEAYTRVTIFLDRSSVKASVGSLGKKYNEIQEKQWGGIEG